MLVLKKMILNNFLSFYERHEFNFHSSGIHWIQGINQDAKLNEEGENENSVGAGKSSFTFGPQWIFFGDIQKSVTKDKIINKKSKKNCFGILYFDVDDKSYRIERYRKHDKEKDSLKLFENKSGLWDEISQADKKDTQEDIDHIIILNQATFLKCILFSREDYKQLFDTNIPERTAIFENIVQLSKFVKYLKRVKKKQKQVNEESIVVDKDIAVCESIMRAALRNAHIEQESIKEKKENILNQIKKIEVDIKLISSLGITTEELIEMFNHFYKLNILHEQLSNDIEKLKELKASKEESIDSLTEERNRYLKLIEESRDKIVALKNAKCPTCGSKITEEKKKTEEEALLKSVVEYDKIMRKSTKDLEEQTDDVKKLLNDIQTLEVELQKTKNEINEIIFKEELSTITQEGMDLIVDSKVKIDFLKQQIDNIDSSNIDRFQKEAKDEGRKLLKLQKNKELLRSQTEMLNFWVDVLDMKNENSLKQFVISKIIPVFNTLLQQTIDYIFDGELKVLIDAVLRETIIKDGEVYDYKELSTGERLKLNLAVNLAIFDLTRYNLSGSNVIFLDEIFNNVDTPTIKKFIEIFKTKYAPHSAVYIISHLQSVKDNIEPITKTTIEKINGNSTIHVESYLQ